MIIMTKTAKTNNISATVNGVLFEGLTLEQAKALASVALAVAGAEPAGKPEAAKAKTAKAPKAKASAKAPKAKHDPVLDSKRVERMTATAAAKVKAAGFEPKTRKQGTWVWLYPSSGEGRTPEFKAVKLAKGWKHSPKRGAFYRDFAQA